MSDYGKQLGGLLRCVCVQVASAYADRGAKRPLLCLQILAAVITSFATALATRSFRRQFLKVRCIESFVDGLVTVERETGLRAVVETCRVL